MPDYESFMLPLLRLIAEVPLDIPAAAAGVADRLQLSADQRVQKPAWAHEPLLVARTRMAAEALAAAGLVRRDGDRLTISGRGAALLGENPSALSREALRRFPEFETYLQEYLARQGA